MLKPQDGVVDSHTMQSHIVIHLKHSKNDPFGVGAWLHLGATGQRLCPVAAFLGYVAVQPPLLGPLFLFWDGTTLSKPRLIGSLCQVFQEVGVESSHSSGHSFRTRAATAAAKLWVSNSMIKVLGRCAGRVCCLVGIQWIALDGSLLMLNVTCYVCLYHWLGSLFSIV